MNKNETQSGRFGGAYTLRTAPYAGPDFSRICQIFPGQGAAVPGMFRAEFDASPAFRARLEQADQFSSARKLPAVSAYILEPGSIPRVDLPLVRNLCLFASEVGLHEHLLAKGVVPAALTGHSFGEYAALVAAGICSFEDMLEVVHHRELAAPAPHTLGAMIAVSGTPSAIAEALDPLGHHLSNINSPGQAVISCALADVDAVRAALKKARMGHKVLADLPQPYHTPMMEPVRASLAAFVQERRLILSPPRIPMFSSVTRTWLRAGEFDPATVISILSAQVVSPVDFPAQVRSVRDAGISHFVELGPQLVCGLFAREILRGVPHKVSLPAPLLGRKAERKKITLTEEKSRIFGAISKVIAAVTGYKVQEIAIEDKFQEDLGIDSIKKAEIIFSVISQSGIRAEGARGDGNLSLSNLVSINDVANFIIEAPAAAEGPVSAERRSAGVFQSYRVDWEPRPFPTAFARGIRAALRIEMNQLLTRTSECVIDMDRVLGADGGHVLIDARGFDPGGVADSMESALPLIDGFRRLASGSLAHAANGRITLVTDESRSPLLDGLSAFLKSLKRESRTFHFKDIRVRRPEGVTVSGVDPDSLARDEAGEPAETDVLYVDGRRFVRQFVPNPVMAPETLTDDSVLVVIGGAKGIGLSLLSRLSATVRPRVHLVGRSAESDPAVAAALAGLRAKGLSADYHRADATDSSAIDAALSGVVAKHGRIDVIINAAGREFSRNLRQKSGAEIREELATKLRSCRNVLDAAARLGVGRSIHFSSTVSAFGNAGQTVYSFANGMLEGICGARMRDTPSHSASVVHWPAWDGVGMTENPGILHQIRVTGISLLTPENAAALFASEFGKSPARSAFYLCPSDFERYEAPLFDEAALGGLPCGLLNGRDSVPLSRVSVGQLPYLRDHALDKVCLFPASSALATFLTLGRLCLRRPVSVSGFAARNMLILGEGQRELFLDRASTGNGLDLRIRSDLTYFSGKVVPMDAPSLTVERPFEPRELVDVESFYDIDHLDFGPAFRLIDHMILDADKEVRARVIDTGPLVFTGLPMFDRLAQWIEAGLQVFGAKGLLHGYGLTVPAEVGAVTVYPEEDASGEIWILPELERQGRDQFQGSVLIVNSRGRLLVALRDLRAVVVKHGKYVLRTRPCGTDRDA